MRQIRAAALTLILAATAMGADPVTEKGAIEAVMLFRGQALVTRVVPLTAPAGAVQLVVTDLPEAVIPGSLFASTGKDLQVRAVGFRTRAVAEAPEEAVRKLDAEIAGIDKKLRANTAKKKVLAEQQSYLAKLESFVAPTSKMELAKGVLNVETLDKITKMNFDRRQEAADALFELEEDSRDQTEKLNLLRRKRGELTAGHAKAVREAVLHLDKTGAGRSQLRLSYLVRNASWSPTYNVRSTTGANKTTIEVGALVQQTSGEDWNGVALTLTTSGAQLVADGPALAPLRINLTRTKAADQQTEKLEKDLRKAVSQLKSNQMRQLQVTDQSEQLDIQWGMNRAVQEMQQIELAADPRDVRSLRRAARERGSGLAANYAIEGKVSLASRRDSQMVQIDRVDLPSTFFYEATPLLTDAVYRYAEMTNESDLSLLEGRASVYLDGRFMGTANLPMVAQGQKVTVGFGTDPQLRSGRVFVSKHVKGQLLGSNKEVRYRYQLVLENYSADAVTVRLLDRIPVETDDVKVRLAETKDPLCSDAAYLRRHRPKGFLRWDVTVPAKAAKAARETARVLEYSFTLEFDAELHIGTEAPEQAAPSEKADFQAIMEDRMLAH
jgi:uncharacterized protein (TIGR02231 family)